MLRKSSLWSALKGMALIDLGDPLAISMAIDILDGFLRNKHAVDYTKFKSFVDDYLKPIYFNRNARFSPLEWAQDCF